MKALSILPALILKLTFSAFTQSTVDFFFYQKSPGMGFDGVRFLLKGRDTSKDSVILQCVTDSNGICRLSIPRGKYRVEVENAPVPGGRPDFDIRVDSGVDLRITVQKRPKTGLSMTLKHHVDAFKHTEEGPKDSEEMKFIKELTHKMSQERAFMESIDELPTLLPFAPSNHYISPDSLFPKLFKNTIVTYNDLKEAMLESIRLCKLNITLGFYRCGEGFAIVAYPHPISEDGGSVPGNYVILDKIPYEKHPTWGDALYYIRHKRVGYERCMIFAFSNSEFHTSATGNEVADGLLYNRLFLSPSYYQIDNKTRINYPRRFVPCKVFTYTFQYEALDGNRIPVNNILDAKTHLNVTGLMRHLLEFH